MAFDRRRIGASLGLAPFLVYVTLFLFIPTIVVFIGAFVQDGQFTMGAIKELKSKSVLDATWATISLSLITALIGAGVGALIAYVVSTADRDGMLRRLVTSMCGVLAQFGGVVLSFAWIATLGQVGIVTKVAGDLFGADLYGSGWLFGLPGLGQYALNGAQSHDVPVIQGVLVASIAIVLISNVVVDALLTRLRPATRKA